jgi:hypothetical protein
MRAIKTLPILFCLSLALTAGACDAVVVQQVHEDAQADAQVQADVAVEVKGEGVADVKAPAKVEVDAKVEVKATLKPEELDLESITFLVKKGKIKDAKALEKKINTPKEKLNDIDLDGDGKVDKIVIVEVKKDDGTIIFELHAVPSKSKKKEEAVVVAFINFVPDKTTNVLVVKAVYAPVFVGHDVIVYDYTVPIVVTGDTFVVSGGVGFYGWLYTVHRPAYYGVFVYEYDPYPVFVVDVHYDVHHGGCWPPGHCKHGKWKGKGKHWGGHHGGGKHGKWH